MRLTLFALFALFALAACAPVSSKTLDGTSGDVLPVEAQRVIDAATATAARMGTQNAQATATDQSARATATAGRAATLDALAAQQTQVSLQMTQAAGYAAATDTMAARTPTAAAMRTQAAIAADEFSLRRESAASPAEFWQTIRTLIVALLIVGGLTAIAIAAFDRVTAVRIARLSEQAAIAREAFRLLPPGHWAEWAPGDGYQVYPLPGLLDAPAAVIENTPTTPDRAHEWRQAVRLFCWWGERYGFGIHALGAEGAGVVGDPGWRTLSKLLKGAGVLAETAIPGKKGKVTGWAADWDYRKLHDALGHGRLALPYPPDDDPPKVLFAVPTQQAN